MLRIMIEIPTPEHGAVFEETTKWRLRSALPRFLDDLLEAGAHFDPEQCVFTAEYVYPRWHHPEEVIGRVGADA